MKKQRERELLISLYMVRSKKLSLERQGGYQKLREMGYWLGDIASKIGFSKYVGPNVFRTYKQTSFDKQLPEFYLGNAVRVRWQ